MRRGDVGVGVLRVFMGKVYAEVVAWHPAFGALLAGRGDLVAEPAGDDAVTGCATTVGRMAWPPFANCDMPASPVQGTLVDGGCLAGTEPKADVRRAELVVP